MRRIDGTSINPNHLAYRWTVEVKGEEGIKEEKKEQKEGSEIRERKKKYGSNPQSNL